MPFHRKCSVFSICLLGLLASSLLCTGQIYPVTVTLTCSNAPSAFLADYGTDNSQNLFCSLRFNDLHEPSWNVFVRISLESGGLHIESNANYRPMQPITLYPGIPYILKREDLGNLMDIKNLDVAGFSKNTISQTGRLPEGNYMVSMQAFDFQTGKLLSNKAMAQLVIRLTDPPKLLSPLNEETVKAIAQQVILFQWSFSPDFTTRNTFTFELYQVNDPSADPQVLVEENRAPKVMELSGISTCSFLYGTQYPLLLKGQEYAWRIKADNEQCAAFKNNGYSVVYTFRNGFPGNGQIELTEPADNHFLGYREDAYFKWRIPDNFVNGEQCSYLLELFEKKQDQSDEDAMQSIPWFSLQTKELGQLPFCDALVSKRLHANGAYLWRVKAFAQGEKVAESGIYHLYGPPVLEYFRAGNHAVQMTRILSDDLLSFSGEGRIQTDSAGHTTAVSFSKLHLVNIGGEFKLREGEIRVKTDKQSFLLEPEIKVNHCAIFECDSILLSKDRFDIHGQISWKIPQQVMPGSPESVQSVQGWLSYEEFRLTGELSIDTSIRFTLADPEGFNIWLGPGSNILVRGTNQYRLELNGEVNCRSGTGNELLHFPFSGAGQLLLLDSYLGDHAIFPIIEGAGIYYKMVRAWIDLTETAEMSVKDQPPEWMGIAVTVYSLILKANRTSIAELTISQDILFETQADSVPGNAFTIDGKGMQLTFHTDSSLRKPILFNTFEARLKSLSVVMQDNRLVNGVLTGEVRIPLITDSAYTGFTIPIGQTGWMQGFLNSSLEGMTWGFNKEGGDQHIQFLIQRAVFEDKCRLSLQVAMSWPSLKISNLQLNDLYLWGNGDLGFGKSNGTTDIEKPISIELEGYPYEVTRIGAGYSDHCYAFGISGNLNAGSDVSGANGPVQTNLYSILQVDREYSGSLNGETTPDRAEREVDDILFESNDPEPEVVQSKLENRLASYISAYDSAVNQLNDSKYDILETILPKIALTPAPSDSLQRNNYFKATAEAHVPKINLDKVAEAISPSDIAALIDFLSAGMPDAQAGRLQKLKAFLSGLSGPELRVVYLQLTDVGKLVRDKLEDLISGATEELNASIDKIDQYITSHINAIKVSVNTEIASKTEVFFTSIQTEIARAIPSLTTEDLQLLEDCIQKVSEKFASELQQSFSQAIDNNITSFFTDSITGKLRTRLTYALHTELCQYAWDDLKDGRLDIPLKPLLDKISSDLSEQVDYENLRKIARNFGNQLVANIDFRSVYDEVLEKFGEALLMKLDVIKEKVGDKIDQLKEQIQSRIDDMPSLSIDNVGAGISLDFRNLGEKLKNRDAAAFVKFDPVIISCSTRFCSFKGKLEFQRDEPVYGDIWKGEVEMVMSKPVPFAIGATYINGRKGSTSYWLLQVNPSDEPSKGDKLVYRPRILKKPFNLGFVKLMAVSGIVYHHMNERQSRPVPDEGIDYGAYLGFVVFDGNSNGRILRAEVAGRFVMNQGEDYNVTLDGNLQACSNNYSVLQSDPYASVSGSISLCYNSAEKHFIGLGKVQVVKPGVLCAKGMLFLDISPGKWEMAVGSRDDRILFQPGCQGWAPAGWLNLNQSKAEIGLGVQLSFTAEKTLRLKIIDLGLFIDAGIAAGLEGKINYHPFGIDELGIWADLWALILINYTIHLPPERHGSINLVDIRCKGDLIFRFSPSPVTLFGDIRGHCKILGCIGCNFNGHFEKKLA